MLLFAIGMLVVGVILIKRGNGYVQQAAQCEDREEKVALEALGNRTRIWGMIAFGEIESPENDSGLLSQMGANNSIGLTQVSSE